MCVGGWVWGGEGGVGCVWGCGVCVCVCTHANLAQRSEENLAVVSFQPRGTQRSVCRAWQPVPLPIELSSQHQNLFLASEVGKGSDGSPRPALGKWQGGHEEPHMILEPSLVKCELASP